MSKLETPLFSEVYDFRPAGQKEGGGCGLCGSGFNLHCYLALGPYERWYTTYNYINEQKPAFCSWHCCRKYFFRLFQLCRLKGVKFDIEDIPF